ncbi:MAG TPA: MbnP family copper-binding protein [Candidatus Acidoferrales bacterium]|nr:MbnP family copper-binding protein [Candidatus Acidoferrales bacterium]HXK01081.1 MbnP family copper-binding protein [Verrucomicrobiae bacterium]
MKLTMILAALLSAEGGVWAADQQVTVRFQAMVGSEKFACGRTYPGIGTTASTLAPRDFRFYVHNVALIDDSGKSVPLQFSQDGRWQLDDVALLDFEDATGGCVNGTPDVNDRVTGTVPAGHYTGLRFTLGVPFNKNHTDLTTQPPPLNLTALAWVWNAGRKFARLDFASTGQPRGYAIHLGSTGCTPNENKTAPPVQCSEPNRVDVELAGFDARSDVVVADLAALLKDSNIDTNQPKTALGCMSSPEDGDCAPLFANLGLPFAGHSAGRQSFFRKAAASDDKRSAAAGN